MIRTGLSVSDRFCLDIIVGGMSNLGIYFVEEIEMNFVGTNIRLYFTKNSMVLSAFRKEEHYLRVENSFLLPFDY